MAYERRPRVMGVVLAIVLFATCCTGISGQTASPGTTLIRFCVVGDVELTLCLKMMDVLRPIDATVNWSCSGQKSVEDCVSAVAGNIADLMVVDAHNIIHLYMQYGMKAIMSEEYGAGAGVGYYDVAVVDASLCARTTPPTLSTLRGLRSCHTGYRDDMGWALPLGALVDQGVMEPVNHNMYVNPDIQTVETFFNKSCAPGEQEGQRICTACAGICGTGTDSYAGYKGAFRCLSDSVGDVAFVNSATVLQYAKGGELAGNWSTRAASEFRFLCPSGGCQPVNSNIGLCYLAKVPANVLMTRRFYDATPIVKVFTAAINETAFANLFLNGNNNFSVIFEEGLYGLVPISMNTLDYVGASALRAYEAYDTIEGTPLTAISQDPNSGTAVQNGGTATGSPTPPPATIKWCTLSNDEQAFCLTMADVLMTEVAPGTKWGCVQYASSEECMNAISGGEADLVTFDSGDVFLGYTFRALKAIMAETYKAEADDNFLDDAVHAVAVVKKSLCDAKPSLSFADLRGMVSCHTGYRKTAGWVMPIGFMVDMGLMETINTNYSKNNDIETVASYFSAVCAPGEQPGARLCSACAGDCGSVDPYNGYAGALNCLMNGGGDVAFVEYNTVSYYAQGGAYAQPWANTTADDLRFLCPQLGCQLTTSASSNCTIAAVPPHAVVSRSNMIADQVQAILTNASSNSAFRDLVFNGNNKQNLIFRIDATGLIPVTTDTRTFLGATTLEAYSAIFDLDTTPVATNIARWCVTSGPELDMCTELLPVLQTLASELNWACVPRRSKEECHQAVIASDAELVVSEGRFLGEELVDNNLTPLVVEDFLTGTETWSTAVAVVRSDFCSSGSPTLESLRGKASCHPSVFSTAGWTAPIGTLIDQGLLQAVNVDAEAANDVEAARAFFSSMCAPGEPGSNRTCTACNGDCGLHSDPYAGHIGAFRCLMEGAGDVAFVDSSIPLSYAAQGPLAQPWATKLGSDFRLLCPTGGCAGLESAATCSFGNVPGGTIVARQGLSDQAMSAIKSAVTLAVQNSDFRRLFLTGGNNASLVFNAPTRKLNMVNLAGDQYLASSRPLFLSQASLDATPYTGVASHGPPASRGSSSSGSSGSNRSGGGGGMSGGAIAGIIIGVLLGLALLTVLTFIVWKRRYSKLNHYEDISKMRMTAL